MIDDALIVRTSPFHDRTSLVCLTNAWTTISGTTLVSSYRNVELEYWAMFRSAGVVDVSYQIAVRVVGNEAAEALENLILTRIGDLAAGSFFHTAWCTDEGFVVGEGLLLRQDSASFLLLTRAPCVSFIEMACSGFDCTVEIAGDAEAGLELIGPAAPQILESAGFSWAPALHPGSFVSMTVRGVTVHIACLEHGGAPAFAVRTAREGAVLLWDRLRRAGAQSGLLPVGTAAHTIVRLEAGEPAYGLDYMGALVAPSWRLMSTPDAIGFGPMISNGKTRFNGSAALRDAPRPRRRLVSLAVEGAGTLAPAFITAEGLPVGHVTSAAWSPRLGCGLVLAWIETINNSPPNGLRLVSPVRGAAAELTDSNRDGRHCTLYVPA